MADSIETEDIENLRRRLEMLELIFESIHNGAMVTDADGVITHFNKPYGQFLGRPGNSDRPPLHRVRRELPHAHRGPDRDG